MVSNEYEQECKSVPTNGGFLCNTNGNLTLGSQVGNDKMRQDVSCRAKTGKCQDLGGSCPGMVHGMA
jgi:hypothetical protein